MGTGGDSQIARREGSRYRAAWMKKFASRRSECVSIAVLLARQLDLGSESGDELDTEHARIVAYVGNAIRVRDGDVGRDLEGAAGEVGDRGEEARVGEDLGGRSGERGGGEDCARTGVVRVEVGPPALFLCGGVSPCEEREGGTDWGRIDDWLRGVSGGTREQVVGRTIGYCGKVTHYGFRERGIGGTANDVSPSENRTGERGSLPAQGDDVICKKLWDSQR